VLLAGRQAVGTDPAALLSALAGSIALAAVSAAGPLYAAVRRPPAEALQSE
jgi:hypothetical protein